MNKIIQRRRRRLTTLPRAIKIVWLIFATMWFLPIYFDGTRSILLTLFNSHLESTNRQWFSIGAGAILVLISYAWRRSPRVGATVQLGTLAAIIIWSITADPAVIDTWWAYAGTLAIVCTVTAVIVTALLWVGRRQSEA